MGISREEIEQVVALSAGSLGRAVHGGGLLLVPGRAGRGLEVCAILVSVLPSLRYQRARLGQALQPLPAGAVCRRRDGRLGLNHCKLIYPRLGRQESLTDPPLTGAKVVGKLLKRPLRIKPRVAGEG